MGRFFTNFDEAWRAFLDRREQLEDFFALFPEEDGFLLGWLLQLDDALAPAVHQVQRAFSQLDWITPQPDHFLHTWIASVSFAPRRPTSDEIKVVVERAEDAWVGTDVFDVKYRRVTCFHTAVVVEVESEGPGRLVRKLVESGYWNELPIEGAMTGVEMETFLPHLTIGTVNRPSDPVPLRDALIPLREVELGQQRIRQTMLCVVPASRSTILDPWEVVGSVAFS